MVGPGHLMMYRASFHAGCAGTWSLLHLVETGPGEAHEFPLLLQGHTESLW